MATLKLVKPTTEAERTTRTVTDTIEVTPDILRSWQIPEEFQRPLHVNEKLLEIAKEIAADGGVIPGVITLGMLDGVRYLVDGQHRREAFYHSECIVGYVDIRVLHFKTMAEMAEEYEKLNSQIVKMRPDDHMRALQNTCPPIAKIRKRCPFVGFDMVRRGDRSPILSMSTTLRCWNSSSKEVPQSGGTAAKVFAKTMLMEDADRLIDFLDLAMEAWGRDVEYQHLWKSLNLTLCMWLYRRIVVAPYSVRTPKVSKELFKKCLHAVSADSNYLDYLQGRQLSERDRSPAYNKIKLIFAKRMEVETGKKPLLPQPTWASNSRSKRS